MNAIANINRSTLRMICLVVAGLVLTGGLLAWKQAADSAANKGYSVTIEQLQ